MKKVVVIGAGISGLAAAFEIREKAKAAGTPVDISILEAEERPGGKMHTEIIDSYLCEWGPNGYLDSKVHATDFCKRAGLEGELVPASNVVNRRFLYAKGKLRVLPDSPPRFFLSNLLSIRGRLRIMLELLKKPAPPDADETVTEFATRRLGREALEMLLDPFVAGVFAGNPDTLSLKSCFPRIHEMEQTHGSLVKALFALRKKRKAEKKLAKVEGKTVAGATSPRGHLTSLKHGMGQLIETLAGNFGDSFQPDCAVSSIKSVNGKFHVLTRTDEIEADSVVLAVPAFQAAKMLASVAPDTVRPLENVECGGRNAKSWAASGLQASSPAAHRKERRCLQ
jgi:oxygen-dependent protoporphyrinogen oxidase